MNNQQVNQVLTFYRINFNFHDPYKFLLDGNFIKLILEKEVDFKKRLENAITGKCKFYVPNCLIRQLELLGNDFKLVLDKAKEYKKISCKHPLEVSVDQCIKENLVGEQNPEKYIVCTQDIELRRHLRGVMNCPLMYFGPDQRIKFQDVHKKNLAIIEKQAKQKLLPKQNELGQIVEYKKEQQKKQRQQQLNKKKELAYELGIKFKTKVAKGPNPLSIRKRKVRQHQIAHHQSSHHSQQQSHPADEHKKKRIRKKKNKNKQPQQSNEANNIQEEN